jgi:hypothetical protein
VSYEKKSAPSPSLSFSHAGTGLHRPLPSGSPVLRRFRVQLKVAFGHAPGGKFLAHVFSCILSYFPPQFAITKQGCNPLYNGRHTPWFD